MNHHLTSVSDKVRSIVQNTLAESSIVTAFVEITPDAVLADLGADPLDVMHIVCAMEEAFGVSIADDLIDAGSTVADVIAAVQPKAEAA